MITRNALLREYRDFFASFEPIVYPTFNFGYPVSIEAGQGSLVHFFNCLQRGVHGRSWYKRNTDQPMTLLGFGNTPTVTRTFTRSLRRQTRSGGGC